MPAPSHVLLVNPSAGNGRARDLLPGAERALAAHGIDYRVVMTRSAEHACAEAASSASAGERVVIVSGDGLIGQVGGTLARTGAAMGVIPGGRGNDFARALGIPTEVVEAVGLLAAGTTRAIDVGEVNGRRFLCIASCGFDSDANRIANEAKLVRGNLVYLYAALRALAAWKPAEFVVTVDGAETRVRGYSVAVANSKAYGGGMLIAPNAEIDDGELDIVISGDVSKLRFLSSMPKLFKGTHIEHDEVQVLRGAEVRVEADRPFAVYGDGDHIADLPAALRLLPGALDVIAPAAPA